MKRVAAVGGCVLAGVLAGAIWTWLQSDRYRADARVLVRPASARVVPAVEALAESSLVASNVAQTLHLPSAPDISAQTGKGGVLTVSTAAGTRERARQIDAEAVVVLMQKVGQRFGNVGVSATVLDPAHVAEQTSPTPGRNLLIGGVIGLVAGIALAAAAGSRRTAGSGPSSDGRIERRLQSRIDQVAKRERALAQRAGQLAAREQDLGRRERELETPPALPEPPAEREPEPDAEPPPPPPEPLGAGTAGRWTLRELEALARERAPDAAPEQQEEWSTYLFLLRQHADADGVLPSSFEPLVNDIFGPLPQPDS